MADSATDLAFVIWDLLEKKTHVAVYMTEDQASYHIILNGRSCYTSREVVETGDPNKTNPQFDIESIRHLVREILRHQPMGA